MPNVTYKQQLTPSPQNMQNSLPQSPINPPTLQGPQQASPTIVPPTIVQAMPANPQSFLNSPHTNQTVPSGHVTSSQPIKQLKQMQIQQIQQQQIQQQQQQQQLNQSQQQYAMPITMQHAGFQQQILPKLPTVSQTIGTPFGSGQYQASPGGQGTVQFLAQPPGNIPIPPQQHGGTLS